MSTRSDRPAAEVPARRSLLVYQALISYLFVVKVVLSLASVEGIAASQDALFSWPLLGVLALAGGISVWLEPRTGLAGFWDPGISTRKRLLLPALVGLGFGAIMLAVQARSGFVQTVAAAAKVSSINVEFPASLLFYSAGAIILESLYRLILITLPLWLISNVILRKRGRNPVFWILALVTSALEPAGQVGFLAGHLDLIVVIGGLTFGVNVFEAHLFRRYGFLAPLAFRLAYYAVWHVVGGALG